MIILAIETSCDDTCIAIVKTLNKKRVRFKILSNIISSQVEIHKKWGGVFPALAKREHQKNLVPVLKKALKEAKLLKKSNASQDQPLKAQSELPEREQELKKMLKREECLFKKLRSFLKNYSKPKIDLVVVTTGPGLEPCLWVGVNFAKALAYSWKLPIIPINHIEAHIFANLIGPSFPLRKNKTRLIKSGSKFQIINLKNIFSAVCLIVSGGHTQLILMKGIGKYKILGETRDDAAGECFDKTARILGMDYPGGPAIAAQAAKLKTKDCKLKIKLPRPMIHQKNLDFSFSGLKTAVLYNSKEQSPKIRNSKKYIQKMSSEIQQAIIDVLISKTIKAAKKYKVKTIILGGGVAANKELRKQFNDKIKIENDKMKFLVPPKVFCTDNALMVAITGYSYYLKKKIQNQKDIQVKANLRIT